MQEAFTFIDMFTFSVAFLFLCHIELLFLFQTLIRR